MLGEVRSIQILKVAMKWLVVVTSGRMTATVSMTIHRDAHLVAPMTSLVAHDVAPQRDTNRVALAHVVAPTLTTVQPQASDSSVPHHPLAIIGTIKAPHALAVAAMPRLLLARGEATRAHLPVVATDAIAPLYAPIEATAAGWVAATPRLALLAAVVATTHQALDHHLAVVSDHLRHGVAPHPAVAPPRLVVVLEDVDS